MKSISLSLSLFLSLLGWLFVNTVSAQVVGNIKLESAKQGVFKGGTGGTDEWLPMTAFNMESSTPVVLKSGAPAGASKHKPITITKDIDKASPLIFAALNNNEVFKIINIQLTKPGKGGKQVIYENIELTNAVIGTDRQSDGKEDVAIMYEKIQINTP
jgi:type VI secretion system secreted protein Hcp